MLRLSGKMFMGVNGSVNATQALCTDSPCKRRGSQTVLLAQLCSSSTAYCRDTGVMLAMFSSSIQLPAPSPC